MAWLMAQVEPPPPDPPFGLPASLGFAAVGLAMVLYIAVVLYRESDDGRGEDSPDAPTEGPDA